ncbi:MAG: hypothetical protein WC155_01910 [Candidatus Cloacimonadales bacterium]
MEHSDRSVNAILSELNKNELTMDESDEMISRAVNIIKILSESTEINIEGEYNEQHE